MKRDIESWIWALLQRETPVQVELSNTPLEFRPMKGWRVISPGIAQHLFYFCRRGGIVAVINGGAVILKGGDAIWISPGTPFRFECPDPESCMFVRFRLKVEKISHQLVALKKDYRLGRLENFNEIWLDLLRQKILWDGVTDGLALRSALGGLLVSSFAGRGRAQVGGRRERRFSSGERRLLFDWLESLPVSARPTLTDLAAQLRLSTGYANQICRRSLGMSAERWLIVQRIMAAGRQLKESNLSVSEVAERFGYSSLYFFSRQFRSVMKCSPREWRQHSQF